MVEVNFWKMHGLGNDFIIIDNRDDKIKERDMGNLAKKLCRRRFSVGADGLVFVCNSEAADVGMRIFNSDGSEAEMCGNGIRCLAKYCYENGIVKKKEMNVETLAGVKKLWLKTIDDEVVEVKVDMGKPIFERNKIPMLGEGKCINEDLKVNSESFKVTCLSIGNPHCIIFVDDVKNFPVRELGPKIENHRMFPKRTNVEFVQVLSKSELYVRVWERGCGETLACGTGACASVIAGVIANKVKNKSIVHLLGGDLKIDYSERVFMEGKVEKVFEGRLFL